MNDFYLLESVITSMLRAVDTVDWATARSVFCDTVQVDYTSLQGGQPSQISADKLIATWQVLVPGFDATQHLAAGLSASFDSDRADALTNVYASHYIKNAEGGEVWTIAGQYKLSFQLVSSTWKISSLTLVLYFQTGNLDLPRRAQARAAKSPRMLVS